MNLRRRLFVLVWSLTLLAALSGTTVFAQETKPMHFFARLLPIRPGFPDSMTADEERVMGEHFNYCKRLTMEKSMVLAGPCQDPIFGLFILQAPSLEAATEIVKNDPSVLAGIHKFEIQPFYLSLMMQNISTLRYPKEKSGKVLHKTATVSAPVGEVWKAWTTSDGIKTMFDVRSTIELRIGGKYEWYFNEEVPEGQRGSEDCLILSFLPEKMLSFEWNAPPTLPNSRRQRTVVVMLFDEKTPGQTTIDFTHSGFGVGEEWDKTYEYFDRAWDMVLKACAEKVGKM